MPAALTYPGVYIQEVASDVRTIVGVATSITAFIGRALRGPTDRPRRVQNFADFERMYGGLWELSTLGYSVQQFFANGGAEALIVRVHRNAPGRDLRPRHLQPDRRQRRRLGRTHARARRSSHAPADAGRSPGHAFQSHHTRHGGARHRDDSSMFRSTRTMRASSRAYSNTNRS